MKFNIKHLGIAISVGSLVGIGSALLMDVVADVIADKVVPENNDVLIQKLESIDKKLELIHLDNKQILKFLNSAEN